MPGPSTPTPAPALAGGSLSKVGVFSLGIVPYINASILLQLLSTAFPSLKKLQREEGPQGRARFQQYQKAAALVFAVAQAVGQLSYLRPYVDDFSPTWLGINVALLSAGAMILVHVSMRGGEGAREAQPGSAEWSTSQLRVMWELRAPQSSSLACCQGQSHPHRLLPSTCSSALPTPCLPAGRRHDL